MIGRLTALILLSTFYLIQTAEVPHQIPLTVADLGDNLTLTCPLSGVEARVFSWYKLKFGYMVQTVATGSQYNIELQGLFNNSRFTVTEGKTLYYLNITNVSKEDEATYFCQSGASFFMKLLNATLLAVNDHKNVQKSVHVKQRPETVSVQSGDPVTLQCSLLSKNKEKPEQCPSEHSVYWIRAGSGESNPSIIYTHSNSSDEEEERSCVYSLSKTIQNSSDTGTYYCAVVTCGEILFGEGTTVETRSELDPVVIVLGVLLACCGTVIVVILIFYISRRGVCEHCKAGAKRASHNPGNDKSSVDQSTDLDGDAEAVNYAALNFSTRKVKRVKKSGESPQDYVYSAVRANHHTQHSFSS